MEEEKEERIGLSHYEAKQILGKGSFGEVYLVQRIDTGELGAMKVLSKNKVISQNMVRYAMTERSVLGELEHPFIVRLRHAFQTSDYLFLILDYCPGGDLSDHLRNEGRFSEERARFYACEIVLALEALHSRDILFRDLKPDNVVLDSEGHALLTDFGLSKEGIEHAAEGTSSFCGSMGYLAPEIYPGGGRSKREGNKGHGKAVDWYMLGVLVYEMVTGEVFGRVIGDDAEKIDSLEGTLSAAGRRFLRGLL